MTGSQIRELLHNGGRVYGTHIVSLGNPVAAAMSAEMELDFAFFCTEHMPLGRTEISMMCQLYAAKGISPVVRVPSPDAAAVGMALDAGAEGIVVPYLESLDDARRMAGAVKYRPLKGKMLSDVLSGESKLNSETIQFLQEFNNDRYLIIGIESVPAIEKLEQLIDASEADGVFLGPHDITISMGIPTQYDHPDFIDTIEDVMRRCHRRGVGVGLHTQLMKLPEGVLQRFFDAGMSWVINGADVTVMRDAMNDQLRQLRKIAAGEHSFGSSQQNGMRKPVDQKRIASCLT